MTNHQLNEPAFPIRGGLHEHQFIGMSLRDYFAAKAMQGFLSSYQNGAVDCGLAHLADDAYDMADAMLKARLREGPPHWDDGNDWRQGQDADSERHAARVPRLTAGDGQERRQGA